MSCWQNISTRYNFVHSIPLYPNCLVSSYHDPSSYALTSCIFYIKILLIIYIKLKVIKINQFIWCFIFTTLYRIFLSPIKIAPLARIWKIRARGACQWWKYTYIKIQYHFAIYLATLENHSLANYFLNLKVSGSW